MVEAMQLDIFKMVMENLNLLIFVAGVICFLTVVITQVTKGPKMPTKHTMNSRNCNRNGTI